ncbi:unnamed protein product [marine sediment metagenome]|uniref:Uncharacterized protein n=1 Tax=marine sediment metagenome TaxID=412755 RepID=X0Y3I5_9ZZZZ
MVKKKLLGKPSPKELLVKVPSKEVKDAINDYQCSGCMNG